ncbi:phage tail tape measure protein [Epilithonimonas mollis]|uniref:Phage tail tape measure protein, TP901 family, core region n=1 Tax=Epilithonimonas mollis TaxID=216903 RepID=A0A1M6UK16_9FLAO|nr:phage tail tape measure protein [Epilithonimonas mollis]SHK69575.1 phage tail tape measure protein, TP901 family, core region [Epilithonimonas mollis]
MAMTSKLLMLIDLSAKMFNNKFEQLQNKWAKGVDKMKAKYQGLIDKVPGLNNAIDAIKNPGTLFLAGITAVAGGLFQATNMANDWHKQMAEINVTAELGKQELQGLSDKLLQVGTRNVAPLEEIPKAFSRIISAGLSVNQSMEALEPTLRAAKAGFTDIETVASAGIAVMMSSGKDINRVYDVLFQTVKAGNAEFKDIARYLPKVVPLARSIGYELESTAGAYASLTTKLSAEQSTTALEGIYRTLSNADVAMGKIDSKTGKYASGFRAIGINIFDSAGKIRPLIDIVTDLNKQMDGLTNEQKVSKLSKLGFDQSTALGFGTLMQDIEGLKSATAQTTGAQNALNKAYMDSLTPTEQWGLIQNNIKASMIKLGERVLPYVTTALEKLTPVFQWLFQNIDTIIPVAGSFVGILGTLTAATWLWNLALAANPVGLTIVAISALIALVTAAIVKYDKWGATLLLFLGPIGRVISAFVLIYKHWDSIKKAFQTEGIIGGLKRLGMVLLDVILQPIEQLLGLLSHLPGSLGDTAKEMQGQLRGWRDKQGLITDDEKINRAVEAGKLVMYNGNAVLPATKARLEARDAEKNAIKAIDPESLYGTTGGKFNDNPGEGKKKLKDDVNKVTGDAKQVKNITIKIDSLNKGGINMNKNSAAGMTLQEVEDWFNDAMMRIMRNAELS